MFNISTFGLTARVVASNTFPNGFGVSAWADDSDPLDSPDVEVAEANTNTNGDLVTWSKPGGIEIVLAVVPFSNDDLNLDVLLEANRVGKNKNPARDVINIALAYPNGLIVSLNPGIIISGSLVPQASNQGKTKSRNYKFRFEQITKQGLGPAAA